MKTNHQRNFVADNDKPRDYHYKFGMGYHTVTNHSEFTGTAISAVYGGDVANGHRGAARMKSGAKKFVRSRTRFHETQKIRKYIKEGFEE